MIETEDWSADASTLPDTLWELLELALDDLKKVERRPGVQINMNEWIFRTGDNSCHACMAGAVLLETCKLRWKRPLEETRLPKIDPGFLRSTVCAKLEAINDLRVGALYRAAVSMSRLREFRTSNLPDDYIIRPYYQNKQEFEQDLRNLVEILKSHNL